MELEPVSEAAEEQEQEPASEGEQEPVSEGEGEAEEAQPPASEAEVGGAAPDPDLLVVTIDDPAANRATAAHVECTMSSEVSTAATARHRRGAAPRRGGRAFFF